MKIMAHMSMVASALFLAACATTTPYQPASKPGGFDGYSQTMIENNRARVTFGGNSLTERSTVEDYLLYRAAEMTVERGFDYFTLTQRDTEERTRTSVNPRMGFYDPYFNYSFYRPRVGWSRFHRFSYFHSPYSYRRGFGRFGYDPFFDNYDIREVTKFRASAEVTFGNGTKPSAQNAFDAREVMQNLGPSIMFPEETG